MNISKEEIINEINNSNDLEYCYQIIYELNDELKSDKELVYLLFNKSDMIDEYDYLNNTLKDLYLKIISNIENESNNNRIIKYIYLGILPNELKDDIDVVKEMFKVIYHYEIEEKVTSIKELHKIYADYIYEQVEDGGAIYGVPLCYTTDLSNELLNDKEFVMSIIESDEENDKKKIYEMYNIPYEEEIYDVDYELENRYREYNRYRGIGTFYKKKYQFEDAIIEFEKGIEIFPYYHGCYVDKADSLVKLGKLDDAINFLTETINNQELQNEKDCFKVCSNDATYPKYTYKLFIKILENKLNDTIDKKNRGYVYKPRKKIDN